MGSQDIQNGCIFSGLSVKFVNMHLIFILPIINLFDGVYTHSTFIGVLLPEQRPISM